MTAQTTTPTDVAPRRDWTNVGARYSEQRWRPQFEDAIRSLDWTVLADVEGGTLSLPFSPGEGIKAAIRDLRLPRVSALAWNGAMTYRYSEGVDDVEYPALYGIECNYKNGRVRVYVVDNGCELVPVCMDVWPVEGAVTT